MKHNKPVKLFHITTGLSEGHLISYCLPPHLHLLVAKHIQSCNVQQHEGPEVKLRNFLLAAFLVLVQSNDSLCSLQVQELHKREAVKRCSLNRCTFSPNLKKQPWPQI